MLIEEFLREARELLTVKARLPSDQDMPRHVDSMVSFYGPGRSLSEQKLLERLYAALSSRATPNRARPADCAESAGAAR